MNIGHIQRVLSHITFAPSCVDMGWAWEVEEVYDFPHRSASWGARPEAELCGFNIRTTFRRPDTDTGEIGIGKGRWWFVETDITESGLVKTAWLACQQIVQHELMEAFMFDGVRVFDPHASVADLCALNAKRRA